MLVVESHFVRATAWSIKVLMLNIDWKLIEYHSVLGSPLKTLHIVCDHIISHHACSDVGTSVDPSGYLPVRAVAEKKGRPGVRPLWMRSI